MSLKRTMSLTWCCVLFLFMAQDSRSLDRSLSIPLPGESLFLHDGWMCKNSRYITEDGNTLSDGFHDFSNWMPATVPGTVLTTLVRNGIFPDPDIGMNNEKIPDIYDAGREFYTYWFVNTFRSTLPDAGMHVWLNFRGINDRAEIFLNGKRINNNTYEGMFLRASFDITRYLKADSLNTLAVLVMPPDPAGRANGGQGGDGTIAKNITMQCTAGWDWIQPVRDRNTGIWDHVTITTTGPVRLQHPYVITRVPGVRTPGGKQGDAFLYVSTELENIGDTPQKGTLVCRVDGQKIQKTVTLAAGEKRLEHFSPITLHNPQLWWPNGIGGQPLYDVTLEFLQKETRISDAEKVRIGLREITSEMDTVLGGRQFKVNGQKVFIRGGNWIASDWMLRLTPERYRAEVRMHRDMNLNMIRVWGGSIPERPEFYAACDEFGILVMQDLWVTGDCNGAWMDMSKKDSRAGRWEYPDNHELFIATLIDQVKMLRNHPSLCFWSGGNEWPPAKDIDELALKKIMPELDPVRLYISYSTCPELFKNIIGGVGDGPYGIQEPEWFYTFHSNAFNPELGSVGLSEIETLRLILEKKDLVPPQGRGGDGSWRYHKYAGYGDQIERYGKAESLETFCRQAQIVNYQQYKAFMEGWTLHMWEWYTGVLIWKNQNPWTALRGQFYDSFLAPNAGLFGLRSACEPVHVQLNLDDKRPAVINITPQTIDKASVVVDLYDLTGKKLTTMTSLIHINPNSVQELSALQVPQDITEVYFAVLDLKDNSGGLLSHNFYWFSKSGKDYTALHNMPRVSLTVEKAGFVDGSRNAIALSLVNGSENVAFFNSLKVFDATGDRILPVFYSDNYFSLLPGEKKEMTIEFGKSLPETVSPQIVLEGVNGEKKMMQVLQ
jgi:mannosylglycoprotein endo-beta-mannosidase